MAENPTTAPLTRPRLAGAWVKGFNAFHSGAALEESPGGDRRLQEQWREGWREAQTEAVTNGQ